MISISDDNNLISILSPFDCIMGFLVFVCLLFFINIIQKKFIPKEFSKIFIFAFLAKCIGAIAFILVSKFVSAFDTLVYYGSILELSNSDINIYFDFIFSFNKEGINSDILSIFSEGRSHYMDSQANATVVKFGSLFVKLVLGSYTALTLIFTTFSFFGIWGLFTSFVKLYPSLKNQFSLAILFLPSALFWGSGLLKDSLTIGCLGYLTYGFFELTFQKNYKKRFIILIFISGWMLLTIKSYIFYTFIVSFIFLLFSKSKYFNKIKYLFFVVIIFFIIFYSQILLVELIEEARSQAETYETIDAGSNVALFEYDFSPLGVLNMFSSAFTAVFFRPYVWESRSALMLISSFESFLFIIITIYTLIKCGIINTFKIINSNPLLLFCLVFSVLFSIVVGFTTFNFGTMSRYKIPCLQFYLIMIFIINHNSKTNDSVKKTKLKALENLK